jgi:hypothetical protein
MSSVSRAVVSEAPWRDEFRTRFDDGLLIRTSRIPKHAPKTPQGVLRRAADILERRGLAKGKMRDENGCRCLYAALLEATGLGYDLDSKLDRGHIDARQVDTLDAYGRFDTLREALTMLGMPTDRDVVAPLARYSDKATTSNWHIVSMLRMAAEGRPPEWTWTTLSHDEIELAPR